MKQRGGTLIEMMIAVAVMGIVAGTAGLAWSQHRTQSAAALERAQARVLLDYLAERVAGGEVPEAAVLRRLQAPLRDSALERERRGPVEDVEVTWIDPTGRPQTLGVTVFVGSR